jgi:hypothetical protein
VQRCRATIAARLAAPAQEEEKEEEEEETPFMRRLDKNKFIRIQTAHKGRFSR